MDFDCFPLTEGSLINNLIHNHFLFLLYNHKLSHFEGSRVGKCRSLWENHNKIKVNDGGFKLSVYKFKTNKPADPSNI